MGISWEFGGNLNGILKVKDKIMAKKENEGLTDEQIRQLLELEAQSKEIAYRRSLPWQERWAGSVKYIRENYDNVWKDLSIERIEQIKRNLEQWRDQVSMMNDKSANDFVKFLDNKISTLKNRIDFLKAQPKPKETKEISFVSYFGELHKTGKTLNPTAQAFVNAVLKLDVNTHRKELAEMIVEKENSGVLKIPSRKFRFFLEFLLVDRFTNEIYNTVANERKALKSNS